mmetsp:Transcript_18366/g.42895  ORF Transcript_18366/g.42895 Transcript_18366/m.42895 type:complete len:812 (+) Transcript_18366:96-2531(+)
MWRINQLDLHWAVLLTATALLHAQPHVSQRIASPVRRHVSNAGTDHGAGTSWQTVEVTSSGGAWNLPTSGRDDLKLVQRADSLTEPALTDDIDLQPFGNDWVDTAFNNGSIFCSAYCAYNMNRELPEHWKGACCQQAFGPANESVGCHETRSFPVKCRCARALRPFRKSTGELVGTNNSLDLVDPRYVCREYMDSRMYEKDSGRCTAHCAYNLNKELPKHWRGACCERSFNGTNDVSCQELKQTGAGPVQCRCKRDDDHPFLHPWDAASRTDRRYSCRNIRHHDMNLSIVTPDRSTVWTKGNTGGVMCSAYCAYNFNTELPVTWKGACCQDAVDQHGNPFPCSATSATAISCKCIQAEMPFLSQGVDGTVNDDTRYECKFREVTPVDTNQTQEWSRGRWIAQELTNSTANASWQWREGEWIGGYWQNARFKVPPQVRAVQHKVDVASPEIVNTSGNNGGVYCGAYCAYNWNRELPMHWRGACCSAAHSATGQAWSCRRHSEAGLTCTCQRRDSYPFLSIAYPKSADDKHKWNICPGAAPIAYSEGSPTAHATKGNPPAAPVATAAKATSSVAMAANATLVRTSRNNGGVFCAAYCAYNVNSELPQSWKGACCSEAFDHSGKSFSCVAHSQWNLSCVCQQNDRNPWLNSSNPFLFRDTRHVCGELGIADVSPPVAVTVRDVASGTSTRTEAVAPLGTAPGPLTVLNRLHPSVKVSKNRGGIACAAYCGYNWNSELPPSWSGACCLEAWDHTGNPLPCHAHDNNNITCSCAQFDEAPFLSPAVDGESNDDVRYVCPTSMHPAKAKALLPGAAR